MLQAYYDKAMTDRFDSLFGGLWVHEHPTSLRGRYQMLYLDFSRVGGDIEQLSARFNDYCSLMLDDFMHTYRDDYPEETVKAFFETLADGRQTGPDTQQCSKAAHSSLSHH